MLQHPRKIFFSVIVVCSIIATFIFWKVKQESPPTTSNEFPKVQFFKDKRVPATAHENKPRDLTVLFQIKSNATAAEKENLQRAMDRFGLKTIKKLLNNKVDFAKADTADLDEEALAKIIADTGAVEFAETDQLIDVAYIPNDPHLQYQWHHNRVNSFNAWNTTMGQSTILVASCDTGIEPTHPDLVNNLTLPGYNSEDGSTNSTPIHPHGTMTAGAIAAIADNGVGITGVSPKIKILPVKISNNADGSAYFSAMAACIEYAANRGAKVVNLSYEGSESYTIDSAAQYLRSKGGILVMSSGNGALDKSIHPDFSSFIIVGATDQNNLRPYWSNYGTPIDIVAPGVDILTTDMNQSYVFVSGTSLSAPIVSGVAALIYTLKPDWTPAAVENFIFSTATRLGTGAGDNNFGNGLINAEAAVNAAKAAVPTTTTTTVPVVAKVSVVSSSISKPTLIAGEVQTSIVTLKSTTALSNMIVDLRIYNSANQMIARKPFEQVSFPAGTNVVFRFDYQSATTLPAGNYTIQVGVWNSSWATLLYETRETFAVVTSGTVTTSSTTTTLSTTTTTVPPTTTTTTSTTTTTVSGSTPTCSSIFGWNKNTYYTVGAHVRYNNLIYKALSPNRRVTPGSNSSLWALATCR